MRTYRDIPLGGADASAIALAERLNTDLLITLDRQHFAAVRRQHISAFTILPEKPRGNGHRARSTAVGPLDGEATAARVRGH